jgi:hypothetical protein
MPFRISLLAIAVLSLGACSSFPSIQGVPPLSNLPKKAATFVAPYEDALFSIVGPGTIGAAVMIGPNFLPGACDGFALSGDRKLVCEARARYLDDPKEAKPDPNLRFRCLRTLGGGTECSEAGQ